MSLRPYTTSLFTFGIDRGQNFNCLCGTFRQKVFAGVLRRVVYTPQNAWPLASTTTMRVAPQRVSGLSSP